MCKKTKWMWGGVAFAAVFCASLFIWQALGRVIINAYGIEVAMALHWAALIALCAYVGRTLGAAMDRAKKSKAEGEQQ